MTEIKDFDKDQLAEYAKKTFDLELDLRKPLVRLQAEVSKLQAKPAAATVAAPASKPQPTHILNRDNGRWFPWTEMLYKHLTNAVPCDENGYPV